MTLIGNFIVFLAWTLVYYTMNHFLGTPAQEIFSHVVTAASIWALVLYVNR
jgi:hypothetical protein